MTGNKLFLTIALYGLLSSQVFAADEQKIIEREFNGCFLQKADGRVWLREPHVYLGMIGVMGTPPFCLSDELVKKFSPLITDVNNKSASDWQMYHIFSIPKLNRSNDSLILLSLKTKLQPRKDDKVKAFMQGEPSFYEIISADIVSAECVRGEWIQEYEKLNKALNDIVAVSLTSPGQQKRENLAKIIEEGSAALNAMSKLQTPGDFQKLFKKIAHGASIDYRLEQSIINQWQEQFEKCINRLGISPKSHLPKKEESPRQKGSKPSKLEIKELGIEVIKAGDKILKDNLILRGLVVEKILPDKPDAGLKVGDVILDYEDIYDFVMGDYNLESSVYQLFQTPRRRSQIYVLRDDKIMTIKFPSQQK